jgi:hypothetical protein
VHLRFEQGWVSHKQVFLIRLKFVLNPAYLFLKNLGILVQLFQLTQETSTDVAGSSEDLHQQQQFLLGLPTDF